MIPESFITGLLDRADIVDVVERYVPLKKSGRNFMACCPFHKEKTPSFSVSPSKQFFKCFGCGKAGNAIGFIMEMEHLEFPEAVEKLARMYGLDVPQDRSPAKQKARECAKTLSEYMLEAANFYTGRLKDSPKAIDYLKAREISGETAARFALGYSPDGWHALQTLFGDKYGVPELLQVGLVNEKNGRRYDAFRGRIMFPIRNPKGQVIGFGARTMNGDEQPKYLNSPETPIYHKGSELYGLYEGRDAVAEKRRAIVCEGYMDVIQLSQAGFRESVAALGTSITPEHVKKLFKLADNVYFSFDGDSAGRKAARRALEAALPVITDMQQAAFILLPPEHDPDSLIKAEGPQAFEREIEKALPLSNFLRSLLLEGKDLVYAEERAKLVAQAKPFVLAMQHAPILRLTIMKEVAALARLQVEDVEAQYGLRTTSAEQRRPAAQPPMSGRSYGMSFGRRPGFGRGSPRNGAPSRWGGYEDRYGFPRRPEPRVPVKDIRDRMLQCMLCYPSLISEFSHQIEDTFVSSESIPAKRIVEVWRAAADFEEELGTANPASLLACLSGSEFSNFYGELLSDELTIETPLEAARLEIRRAFLELELEHVKTRLLAQSGESGDEAMTALRALNARRIEIEEEIRDAKEEEKAYRRESELISQSVASAAPGDMVLSSNPKVRALQEHLFGLSVDQPTTVAPERPEAVSGAVTTSLQMSQGAAQDRALRPLWSHQAAPEGLPPMGGPPASGWNPAQPGTGHVASLSFGDVSALSAAPKLSAQASASRANREAIMNALVAQAKRNAEKTAQAGVPGFVAPPSEFSFDESVEAFDAGDAPLPDFPPEGVLPPAPDVDLDDEAYSFSQDDDASAEDGLDFNGGPPKGF